MLYIGDVLAETGVFCVLNGKDTKQFSFQFGNQIFVFDDVMPIVTSDMVNVLSKKASGSHRRLVNNVSLPHIVKRVCVNNVSLSYIVKRI